MKTWVVVPTYNEAATIESLLQQLATLTQATILVVDDQSPDGTGQIVERSRKDLPTVRILHRQHRTGLSAAYRDGLSFAIRQGAEAVVHMDADGSHDPKHIPAMLNALQRADMVIGSRYVAHGRINIPWYRRWISQFGNLYIRWILGRNVRDWSSGFKAWRADCLQRVLDQPWNTSGYACLMVMTWWALQDGARIHETPIWFTDRMAGRSKFSLKIMIEDLNVAWRLHQRRLVKDEKNC